MLRFIGNVSWLLIAGSPLAINLKRSREPGPGWAAQANPGGPGSARPGQSAGRVAVRAGPGTTAMSPGSRTWPHLRAHVPLHRAAAAAVCSLRRGGPSGPVARQRARLLRRGRRLRHQVQLCLLAMVLGGAGGLTMRPGGPRRAPGSAGAGWQRPRLVMHERPERRAGMTRIVTALSTSLDGFIAGPGPGDGPGQP